jgi:hypothetical protein
MAKNRRKTSNIRVDSEFKERLDYEYKQFSEALHRSSGKYVSFAEFTKAVPGKPLDVSLNLKLKKRAKIVSPF